MDELQCINCSFQSPYSTHSLETYWKPHISQFPTTVKVLTLHRYSSAEIWAAKMTWQGPQFFALMYVCYVKFSVSWPLLLRLAILFTDCDSQFYF